VVCGPLPAALPPTLCSRASGDVARIDKKGDKKIDADELLLMMKELGWAVPVLACAPSRVPS